MALDAVSLENSILAIFKSYPRTYLDASTRLANAYAAYAGAGSCGTGTVSLTGSERTLLGATLLAAMVLPGNPAKMAAAWAQGYTVFWLTPPVTIVGGQTGSVIAAAGATTLQASLTVIFSNLANTQKSAAHQIAQALHTATLLVTALVTNLAAPPPTIVLPLS